MVLIFYKRGSKFKVNGWRLPVPGIGDDINISIAVSGKVYEVLWNIDAEDNEVANSIEIVISLE